MLTRGLYARCRAQPPGPQPHAARPAAPARPHDDAAAGDDRAPPRPAGAGAAAAVPLAVEPAPQFRPTHGVRGTDDAYGGPGAADARHDPPRHTARRAAAAAAGAADARPA